MKYLLAHDIGTSGNKATLFNINGELIAQDTFNYEVQWLGNGCAEQNADDWYASVCVLTKKLLAHINAQDVVGVSFSGQMQGCLPVDAQGVPLHNSIIWVDIRAKKEEEYIISRIDKTHFYHITGNRPSSSYTLAKLLWLKNNKRDIYEHAHKILNAKDYIIFKLTGVFATDFSDASATNVLDLTKSEWSEEIADKVGISLDKFPVIRQSTDIVGTVAAKAETETGLLQGTPVVCGGGDGSVSALGAMAVSEGDTFATVGTSAWNAIVSTQPKFDEYMRTFVLAHVIPEYYIQLGTMQAAGVSNNWIREILYQNRALYYKDVALRTLKDDDYTKIDACIAQVPAGSKGVLFLPYLMGERSPRWNRHAKGCMIGLTVETTESDLLRAVYEGIAMNLEIILRTITTDIPITRCILTGGGAKSQVFAQILSDVYTIPIDIPNYLESATSIGAAVCAGVGVGIYKDFTAINKFIRIAHTLMPSTENSAIYDTIKPIFDKAYHQLTGIFEDISAVTQEC